MSTRSVGTRVRFWPVAALVMLITLAFGTWTAYLANLSQERHTIQAALVSLRAATLEQVALQWEGVAEGLLSDAKRAELAEAHAQAMAAIAVLEVRLKPAAFVNLSRLADQFQQATDAQIALIEAGRLGDARRADAESFDPAFVTLDEAVEAAEIDAGNGSARAAFIQLVGTLGAFITAAVVVLLLFTLYRLRVMASQRAATASSQRSMAVQTLRGLAPLASAEATARAITETLLGLPFVDVALLFGFVGDTGIVVLAGSGPSDYPLGTGDILPAARAAALRSRAVAGPWVETWRPQAANDDYAVQLTRAGLRAVAFGPIGSPTDPVGLLMIGTRQDGQVQLVENLPTVVEFATGASLLVGSALAERRVSASLRASIDAVVNTGAFRPVFQPVVHLRTGRTIGFEALTRFHDGQRPDRMFADAARSGCGRDLEAATLARAVEASRDLPVGPWLSLNVSADFLVGDQRLRQILAARTRPIVLELTEHDIVVDYAAVRAAVTALGPDIRIAVDDAGTGVANFAHIVDMRPDFVKVDSSIVHGAGDDLRRQALIASLRHFARATDSWLIAEGVETDADKATLESLDVEFGQGFLLARPASASEFQEPDPIAGAPAANMVPAMRATPERARAGRARRDPAIRTLTR
jgi:EAL domain-containing protein (putative c-di-GMP-specific phosphodiesterase class I)